MIVHYVLYNQKLALERQKYDKKTQKYTKWQREYKRKNTFAVRRPMHIIARTHKNNGMR